MEKVVARGAPTAHSKEIERIRLLKPRKDLAKLNVGPFLVLYMLLAFQWFKAYWNDDWTTAGYIKYVWIGTIVGQVLSTLFTHWSMGFRALAGFGSVRSIEDAEWVKVDPAKFSGSSDIVLIERRQLQEGDKTELEISFEFRKHKFVYNEEENCFRKLHFPVKEPFEYYQRASGYGSEAKALAAAEKWGLNKFEVPVPPFIILLKEQVLAPFFVFQVFCVLLWCIDDYWYYSLFTLFMLLTFECTVVGQRQRNLRELHSLQTPKMSVQVYRSGRWELMPGELLLPGDIISIGRPTGPGADEKVVPADCLVLGGSCITEEAVLTGESTPMWKVAISDVEPDQKLNMKLDKQYILFGGTKVLQHTGDKVARIRTPDGGCLAIVLRTGFETAQGQLMRTILHSHERVTANNWETGLFIAFLLIFAVSASYYVFSHGILDPKRSRFKLYLNCVMIITSVIPPELPMELSIAVNTSLVALARKRVFCTEPFRIPFAGKVEVCCFDKTGTLTTDHLIMEGIAAVPKRAKGLLTDLKELPQEPTLVLAACHALVQVQEEVIGDPLEKASIEAVGWAYSSDVAISPDKKVKAQLLHRFHFSSGLKRSSTILRVEDLAESNPKHMVVMKGAPEVVRGFLASIPGDYDTTYKAFAAQGARVIALAYRTLPSDISPDALRSMTREEAERGSTFAGFAVFQCPLKKESEPALRMLADAGHLLVMITGDAPLTACFAASKVHIVTRDVLVLTNTVDPVKAKAAGKTEEHHDNDFRWMTPDEAVDAPFSRDWLDILELSTMYDLCLPGDALAHIEAIGLGPKVIPLTQVFARVSPEQKELVIKTLRAANRITLMCGDGTNDVGGLKAAHVGVALLCASEFAERARKKMEEVKKKMAAKAKAKALGPVTPEALRKKEPEKPKQDGAGQKAIAAWTQQGREITPTMHKMAKWLDEFEGTMNTDDTPMLRPGDASMASSFTAKADSVMPCTDIIKQGRCTLVTTVQMFKILGLLCLSTAYSMSVMYLQGVKLGDIQATLSGFMTAGMFFFISSSKPMEKLSHTRPHPNIFNAYFFLSLIGQFACHMGFLVYMYSESHRLMPEEQRQDSEGVFKPNLVNTVCYLTSAVIQLSTFAANYVGHPFNTSIRQNKGLYTCLVYSALGLAVVAFDIVPGMSSSFGLVEIPMELRIQWLGIAIAVAITTFGWEHMLRNWMPAATPPEKGYQWFEKDLAKLEARKKDK